MVKSVPYNVITFLVAIYFSVTSNICPVRVGIRYMLLIINNIVRVHKIIMNDTDIDTLVM